jgi:hypothetical protein
VYEVKARRSDGLHRGRQQAKVAQDGAGRRDGREQRYTGAGFLVDIPLAKGPLRRGLDRSTAVDVLSLFMAPEVHFRLVTGLGWPQQTYGDWLTRTLAAQLLDWSSAPRGWEAREVAVADDAGPRAHLDPVRRSSEPGSSGGSQASGRKLPAMTSVLRLLMTPR